MLHHPFLLQGLRTLHRFLNLSPFLYHIPLVLIIFQILLLLWLSFLLISSCTLFIFYWLLHPFLYLGSRILHQFLSLFLSLYHNLFLLQLQILLLLQLSFLLISSCTLFIFQQLLHPYLYLDLGIPHQFLNLFLSLYHNLSYSSFIFQPLPFFLLTFFYILLIFQQQLHPFLYLDSGTLLRFLNSFLHLYYNLFQLSFISLTLPLPFSQLISSYILIIFLLQLDPFLYLDLRIHHQFLGSFLMLYCNLSQFSIIQPFSLLISFYIIFIFQLQLHPFLYLVSKIHHRFLKTFLLLDYIHFITIMITIFIELFWLIQIFQLISFLMPF